ncbi:MAG: hypothetical protein M0P04_10130 [Syntrophales bacterium]|jgi:hypothetical protein|nr:hypothetical protein [Syntrophales bacterium]MDD4339523.1 hypothetical protein [Syntrophales bacterium]HOG07860.1 hypothetical protein [Syntrophales bacterium]HPB70387.1 hypothetical protein [Syntrophales bacterium]HQN26120.1 hypothetical protein [Syntrophales bacterium]
MPVYLKFLLLLAAFVAFVVLVLYLGGLSVRRVCFKIIAELEEAGAYSAARAIPIQDERKNIFRVGTGNIRPKALNVLLGDKIVVRTGNGNYHLDRDALARMKARLKADR